MAIANLLGFDLSYPIQPTFKDVSRQHQAYASIETLSKRGIVVGVGHQRFAPNQA